MQSQVSRHRGRPAYLKVTADSLYEAVARGLAAFRDADWAADIGRTTITVVVKQPEVEHKVRMRDFEAWLESNGRSPAEMALKSRRTGACSLLVAFVRISRLRNTPPTLLGGQTAAPLAAIQ